MIHSKKHIYIWRIVLLLFFISNSGFTMLVTSCTMKQKSCCMAKAGMGDCMKTRNTANIKQTISQSNSSCMQKKLVGGSAVTKQAVVEHQFHLPSIKNVTDVISTYSSIILSSISAFPSLLLRTCTHIITTVEKYVLTSILRI